MAETVIKVENLSKQYRLGIVGTGTLSHDLKRWWHKVQGKEDPFLKIGETNRRDVKGESDYVWALKNINFEVQKGEVLGIIGKNGAGKSTLLKLLSRITTPTTGEFKVKGRVSSLLEVGTGFHPELTGRENIYLNGAILGMNKPEIVSKFDEIVAFSGVERYIDTPVKRYSSGMYVRLAFAVAAHLEPEILIIDEVLAVGDAEFQKKCLGKIKDVAGQGRTVLFVSHNMEAVSRLCSRALFIKDGEIVTDGSVHNAITQYYSLEEDILKTTRLADRKDRIGNGNAKYTELWFTDKNNNVTERFKSGDKFTAHALIKPLPNTQKKELYATVSLCNGKGQRLFSLGSAMHNKKILIDRPTEVTWTIDKLLLSCGEYTVDLFLFETFGGLDMYDCVEHASNLIIDEGDFHGYGVIQAKGRDMLFIDFGIEVASK